MKKEKKKTSLKKYKKVNLVINKDKILSKYEQKYFCFNNLKDNPLNNNTNILKKGQKTNFTYQKFQKKVVSVMWPKIQKEKLKSIRKKEKFLRRNLNIIKINTPKIYYTHLGLNWWKEMRLQTSIYYARREYKAYNHREFFWDVFYIEKIIKYVQKNKASHYKIRMKLIQVFKYFKQITRVNPIIFCLYIFSFFIFQINYLHRRKHNLNYSIPKIFTNEHVPLLFTIREFSKLIKNDKKKKDFETKVLTELVLLLSNFKRSSFYTKSIVPYYKHGLHANKYINFIW